MRNTWLVDNIKPILVLSIVYLGFGYFYMTSIRNIKTDPQILIAIVGAIGLATGYYFGSSSGSSKKDDTLSDIATQPTVTQTGDQPQVNVTPEQPKMD